MSGVNCKKNGGKYHEKLNNLDIKNTWQTNASKSQVGEPKKMDVSKGNACESKT